MKKQGKKLSVLASCVALILVLGACDMSKPTSLTDRSIRVSEGPKTYVFDSQNQSDAEFDQLVNDYVRAGTGQVRLVVPYDGGKFMASGAAIDLGAKYKQRFARQNVDDVKVEIVPTDEAEKFGQITVFYTQLTALPPEGCTDIPGTGGADDLKTMREYEIGCGTKSMISRMVARPADLLGSDEAPGEDDARRHGGVVEPYKAGERNEALEGLSASGSGG